MTKRASQFVQKYMNLKQERTTTSTQTTTTKKMNPIEVAQSETSTKCDIEVAQEEVITSHIVLNQEQYKSVQDNLKVLVKSISTSIFCKNLSPVCFIGYNLLSASRTNPVPKCISKYKKILKKVYRDR